ncbi:hypothetical protein [Lentibacillus sp. CBA3610]|uniref:hypothetical protein n=1 Tax=Lentibacillus sp. CBA3610 TaxID=2518176 RepID=UPI0020D2481B|nr:hypothetical protein [Lentibacillus sp. CBA3610]
MRQRFGQRLRKWMAYVLNGQKILSRMVRAHLVSVGFAHTVDASVRKSRTGPFVVEKGNTPIYSTEL